MDFLTFLKLLKSGFSGFHIGKFSVRFDAPPTADDLLEVSALGYAIDLQPDGSYVCEEAASLDF